MSPLVMWQGHAKSRAKFSPTTIGKLWEAQKDMSNIHYANLRIRNITNSHL